MCRSLFLHPFFSPLCVARFFFTFFSPLCVAHFSFTLPPPPYVSLAFPSPPLSLPPSPAPSPAPQVVTRSWPCCPQRLRYSHLPGKFYSRRPLALHWPAGGAGLVPGLAGRPAAAVGAAAGAATVAPSTRPSGGRGLKDRVPSATLAACATARACHSCTADVLCGGPSIHVLLMYCMGGLPRVQLWGACPCRSCEGSCCCNSSRSAQARPGGRATRTRAAARSCARGSCTHVAARSCARGSCTHIAAWSRAPGSCTLVAARSRAPGSCTHVAARPCALHA